ncbi:MAG: 50S ribosomal protein L24 [Pseudomonadota bacterium]
MKVHERQPTRYGKKFKIKKHDRVLILTGVFKGKVATVSRVDKEKDRVLLSGIPAVIRHTKPNPVLAPEGEVHRTRSVHISNVALFVEQDGKNLPSKVRIEKTESGRARVLKKTNATVNEEQRYA